MLTRVLIIAAMLCAAPIYAAAQSADVGVSGTGIVALQPVDQEYVGGPYLSDGIGGIAPGFGAGMNVILSGGLTLAAEYSTAFFERAQNGRLVPGPRPPGPGGQSVGGSGITHLHDSLLSALIGYSPRPSGNTRAVFLIGAALRLDDPRVEHASGETVVSLDDDLRVAATGGIDVIRVLWSRVAMIGGVRYALIPRGESHRYLGIGPHVLRGAVGLRVRLN